MERCVWASPFTCVCVCAGIQYILAQHFNSPFTRHLLLTLRQTPKTKHRWQTPLRRKQGGGDSQNQYFPPPPSSSMEPSVSLSQSSCSRASSIAHAAPKLRWWPGHGSGFPSFPWVCDCPLLLIFEFGLHGLAGKTTLRHGSDCSCMTVV